MRILVDADACPTKEIIVRCAKQRGLAVIMIIDTSHILEDGYSTVITVDKARDSVDMKLVNLLKEKDIVVTQDFGVAAMALAKKATVINQNGMIYTQDNIDRLLLERHIGQKLRSSGKRTINAKKRTKEDNQKFEKTFNEVLDLLGNP